MATEAAFNSAKDAWHEATERAVAAKEKAKKSYDQEKEYRTEIKSFEEWVKTENYQFLPAYQEYTSKRDAFTMAFREHDPKGAGEWQRKYNNIWSARHLGKGEDKGSYIIIITDKDVEQFEQTMQELETRRKAVEP